MPEVVLEIQNENPGRRIDLMALGASQLLITAISMVISLIGYRATPSAC